MTAARTAARTRPAVALLLAATVAAAGVVPPATAARAAPGDEFTWAVQPANADGPTGRGQFVYDVAPGQQIDDHVAITNLSAQPLTFAVYATDAFTATDGAFALLPASQSARDAGTWVGFGRRDHTVRPGQRVVVPFRLTVPADAAPGDHAAGVVASVTEQRTDADGQRVNVDRRVAARIYLRVEGPVTATVAVESVRAGYDNPVLPFARGPMTVTYRVRNTGNVRVGGTVRLRATGPLGVPLAGGQQVDLPELLPRGEVTLTRRLDGVVPAGLVTGAVAIDPKTAEGPLPTVTRTDSVLAPPWTLIQLLLLAGVAVLLYRWRRRRAAVGAGPGGPGGPAGAVRPDAGGTGTAADGATADGATAAAPVPAADARV